MTSYTYIDGTSMEFPSIQGLQISSNCRSLVNIPHADKTIVRSGQQNSFIFVIPRKPIPLIGMPYQFLLIIDGVGILGAWGVHSIVKNEHISLGGLGGDNIRLLRHVEGLVDVSVMQDTGLDLKTIVVGLTVGVLLHCKVYSILDVLVHR